MCVARAARSTGALLSSRVLTRRKRRAGDARVRGSGRHPRGGPRGAPRAQSRRRSSAQLRAAPARVSAAVALTHAWLQDPIEDIEIITNELRLKDIELLEKVVGELKKQIPRGLKKEQKEELASAEKVLAWLQAGKEVRNGMDEWNLKDTDFLNERQLLSAKPVVYLVNLSPDDYTRKKNKWLVKIAEWVAAHGGGKIIPFSGALESQLVDMPEDERAAYLTAHPGMESALPKIIKTGFSAIQLIYFFTAGEDEVKCWTLRRGMKAPQAAGTIHTDFEKGFICAEVMAFDELREAGSEAAVKAKGRYRQEGKMYVVIDGDVILFKFGRT